MANEESNFGNLTPRARQILLLAKQEAERFNHDRIGTEHLLLGILALNEGVAVNVLKSLGLNLAQLRLEVEKVCGTGGATKTDGPMPLTPRLKRVLVFAAQEAQAMNYNFIGTEHLLLAGGGESGGAGAAEFEREFRRGPSGDFEDPRLRLSAGWRGCLGVAVRFRGAVSGRWRAGQCRSGRVGGAERVRPEPDRTGRPRGA